MTASQSPPLIAEDHLTREYIWEPRPVNIWIGSPPHNTLQAHVLQNLRERLESQGCRFVDMPDQETDLGSVIHLGIAFGKDYEEEISPFVMLGQLPKPRGMSLVITVVDTIPETGLFDLARGHLVKKSGHLGILIEGDPDVPQVRRVLWGSMPGNYRLLEGDEEDIFDGLALRVQAHAGSGKVAQHVGDEGARLTWEEWAALPIHHDIAQAGRALGEAGIIEDKVPLEHYGSGEQTLQVLRFLQRSALGEGMRSQIDPQWRIMGLTMTGGGKIYVSPDPMDGHVVPIEQLTWDGYLRAVPRGCPITLGIPSVETHENGLVYLAGALSNAGEVDSFNGFLNFLEDHFSRHERIDILPAGLSPKVTAIEHFHRQPKKGSIRDPHRVEIVYPDPVCFPEIDFPCGMREAELHLLSALFRAKSFHKPGLLDRVVLAVLPGHGTVVVYGGERREMTDILVNGMEMEEVVRI